ncbi:unnamed protein product, partial [Prorocentrum cordatum]
APGPPGKRPRVGEEGSLSLPALRLQVEHYLSDVSLETDEFLHDKVDVDGSIAAEWLRSCPKVQEIGELRGWPVTDEELASALEGSPEIAAEWSPRAQEEGAAGPSLRVRRPLPLPALRRAGWLAQQVEQRRSAEDDERAPLAAVGARVRERGAGAVGSVVAVDGSEATVALADGDFRVLSLHELEAAPGG